MKLSIAIDMGAKNNGVFIAKSQRSNNQDEIISKKSNCFIFEKNAINFSKVSRTANRHKDRNYKRRKMAKKLLQKFVDFSKYSLDEQELIQGLLNNRGFTFLSTSTEFEDINTVTQDFIRKYLSELSGLISKDDFADQISKLESEVEISSFIKCQQQEIKKILLDFGMYVKRVAIKKDLIALKEKTFIKFQAFTQVKNIFYAYKVKGIGSNTAEVEQQISENKLDLSEIDFDNELKRIEGLYFDKEKYIDDGKQKIIESNLKQVSALLQGLLDEITTGSKPRKTYLKEIEVEITKRFGFIQEFSQTQFFNLVGNISNLQLRILRKLFNYNSSHKSSYEIFKNYVISQHTKSEEEKQIKRKLLKEIFKFKSLKDILLNIDPLLTIPPYEDMNNRDTYKCNSMLINPELITDEIKQALELLLNAEQYSMLKLTLDATIEYEELSKNKFDKLTNYILSRLSLKRLRESH